jgi:type IV pilus assembly protein PilY1
VTNCFVKLTLTDTSGVRTAASSVSYTTNFSTMYGWFVDMPESGERVDEDPVLSSGTLVYVSNTPSTSGACSTGGSSYINYVNYATGLAVSGASNTGVLLSSSGLSSSAALAVTSSGKTVATTKDSTGTVTTTTIPVSSSSSTRRISWRRLTDGQ